MRKFLSFIMALFVALAGGGISVQGAPSANSGEVQSQIVSGTPESLGGQQTAEAQMTGSVGVEGLTPQRGGTGSPKDNRDETQLAKDSAPFLREHMAFCRLSYASDPCRYNRDTPLNPRAP